VRGSWRTYGESADDVVVEHDDTPAQDGAHGQLLMARDAELSDQEGVEWCPERLRHVGGHRYPSTRQSRHHDVGSATVAIEQAGQEPASFTSVAEQAV